MMVVISTQYMENYGTPTQSYWKYKGGSDYKVINVPSTLTPYQVLEQVRDQIEYKSSYAEEYILLIVSNDQMTGSLDLNRAN
jgi:hypothetical protein